MIKKLTTKPKGRNRGAIQVVPSLSTQAKRARLEIVIDYDEARDWQERMT